MSASRSHSNAGRQTGRNSPRRTSTRKSSATVQPARRTQEQRRAQTRGKLISAAVELLHEAGFARLTIGDVAARAGLTSGAVQHHFPSTQDLLRGVVDEAIFPMLHIDVTVPGMSALGVAARVDRMVDGYWNQLYSRKDYLVMWELMFGTRGGSEVHELVKSLQKLSVAKAVADVSGIFSDLGLPPKAAFQVWTFIGSQLRGLALLAMFEERRVLKDDLVLLKEAATQLILQRTRRSA